MLILAFDTCLDKTYIVLRTEDTILSSYSILSDERNYHSAYLISKIKEVLKENNKTPKDIDLIASNIGPGSFTGIRACTTVSRIMAQQLNCKAIGISSLEILSKADNDNSVVALDARKNKTYFYDKKLFGAIELEEAEEKIKGRKVITDSRLLERFKPLASEIVAFEDANFKLGEILSELAIEKIKNEDGNWAKVKPLYIQPPPVFGK